MGAARAGSDKGELDRRQSQLERANNRVSELVGQNTALKGRNSTLKGRLSTTQERLRLATAEGDVPDLTGGTLADARDAAEPYRWKLKVEKSISSEDPGTVIAQTPSAGTTLKAGQSIILTVAKKAPPKPPEWVTLTSLDGGGGESKTDEFKVPDGKVRLVYNLPAEGNNAITLYRAPDEYVDLLVNDIDATSGTTRLYDPGTYYLDITGDSYSVQIQQFKRPG